MKTTKNYTLEKADVLSALDYTATIAERTVTYTNLAKRRVKQFCVTFTRPDDYDCEYEFLTFAEDEKDALLLFYRYGAPFRTCPVEELPERIAAIKVESVVLLGVVDEDGHMMIAVEED